MDSKDRAETGLKFRKQMFGGDTVDKRMTAFGAFGEPLQDVINGWAYGDVWQRTAIPARTKSLIVVAMNAAAGHPAELRIHLRGALANGCTVEELQEIVLMVGVYCGIPAANEAMRAAHEILREAGKL
jgi:4-carboxymuconolactone decarboxylase